jgi:CubicO group peptidase (beta-lactamase class C family)
VLPRLPGFDEYVAETLRKWNVPGVAVSIVKDGAVVLSKGYGVRDPATNKPMTKDSIFPIASMSKAFTSFGAGLLVDEGKMSFDAPVVTYLPGFALKDPAASSGLTLRDMLSHRSGMPRHDAVWYHNEGITREQLLPVCRTSNHRSRSARSGSITTLCSSSPASRSTACPARIGRRSPKSGFSSRSA